MEFIKVDDWEPGIGALSARITAELRSGKHVLWLICGGSNIPASVAVMQTLPDAETKNLMLLLTDERYGPMGHADSNETQLMDNGFDVKLSTLLPVLLPELDLAQTAEHYDATIRQAILDNDVIIGQFGIGPDGHIAGILPKSPATTSSELAAGYDAPPYQRLTLTFPALQQITAAYVMVFGGSKHEALLNLQTKALSIIDQPAQILKNIPEAYVYNDQIGGEQ